MNDAVLVAEEIDGIGAPASTVQPYTVRGTVVGIEPLIFNRFNIPKQPKDLSRHIFKDAGNYVCVPAAFIRHAIIRAARFKQDPRNPHKNALDLYSEIIAPTQELCPIGKKKQWDSIYRREVIVQQIKAELCYPCMLEGWTTHAELTIASEHVTPSDFNDTLQLAGRFIGIGAFAPTYGRFRVTRFEVNRDGHWI